MLQNAAFCVQLRRLASDAKPTQGLVAAEMKKLSQVQHSALCQLACPASGELFSILFSFHGRQNGRKPRSSMCGSTRRSTWPRA